MSAVLRAIPWVLALLLIALAESLGVVAAETAKVMFTVLPIMAVLSVTGRGGCRRSTGA